MAPEAIAPFSFPQNPENEKYVNQNSKIRLGTASDIWSLGCILYQIIYGRPPFADLNTIQKLQAIPNASYVIQYPQHIDYDAITTIQSCLHRDPKSRAPIKGPNGLLAQKYLALPSSSPSSSHVDMNSKHNTNNPPVVADSSSSKLVSKPDTKQQIISENNNPNTNTSATVNKQSNIMKSISLNLKQQILSVKTNNPLQEITNTRSRSRGDRWMKPKGESPEKLDMRSVLEKRIGAIRYVYTSLDVCVY